MIRKLVYIEKSFFFFSCFKSPFYFWASSSLLTIEYDLFQENVNKDQFVQDPAMLRERAEARRAAMQQRKG